MECRLDGKRALVTGGSRGIGLEIVRTLVAAGANVFALGKSQANLETMQAELSNVKVVRVDLADWEATRLEVEKIGSIDCLVNNAGITQRTSFLESDKDTLDSIYDVNIKAVFNVSQVVARGMIQDGRPGAIVNMSSVATMTVVSGYSTYSTSKAAVDMLTKVMALELGPHNIRVNCINPTLILTDMGKKAVTLLDPAELASLLHSHPIGRFGEPEECANAVLFLLSDKSSLMTGIVMSVDGGRSL
jgi:L-xylulose reductase